MHKNILVIICLILISLNVTAEQNKNIIGGYKNTDINNTDVRKAAQFAAFTIDKGTLTKIVKAETQVVAGTNYSLVLEITALDGTLRTYDVVVFQPLPGTREPMQLLLWKEILQDNS